MSVRILLSLFMLFIAVIVHFPFAERNSNALPRKDSPSVQKASTPQKCLNIWPPMRLRDVNTRRTMTIAIFDRCGHAIRESQKKLEHFLRCRRTGHRHAINWRLIQLLYRTARHYDNRVVEIISGFRSRKVATLKKSKHTSGRAIDFRIAGVSTRQLRDYLLKTLRNVGVGYYPKAKFVHLDVRKRGAFWVDLSGPGQKSRYVRHPWRWVALERLRKNATQSRRRAALKPSMAPTVWDENDRPAKVKRASREEAEQQQTRQLRSDKADSSTQQPANAI